MHCSEAGQQLQLYIDERLTIKQVRDLEAHFAYCPNCREELAILEEVSRQFVMVQTVGEPENMHVQIMQWVALAEPEQIARVHRDHKLSSISRRASAGEKRREIIMSNRQRNEAHGQGGQRKRNVSTPEQIEQPATWAERHARYVRPAAPRTAHRQVKRTLAHTGMAAPEGPVRIVKPLPLPYPPFPVRSVIRNPKNRELIILSSILESIAKRNVANSERHFSKMRSLSLIFVSVWLLTAMIFPIVVFTLTKDPYSLSLLGVILPPVYIIYRILKPVEEPIVGLMRNPADSSLVNNSKL